jgi:hypothetical protein
MVDQHLQERFTRHCTDAAFGYATATTAAYAAFADQVLSFWANALQPSARREPQPPAFAWGWPVPASQPAPPPMWNPFAWAMPQSFAPSPYTFAGPGSTANSFAGNPFAAWLGMFPFAANPAAWPMACMFMASGVPRSVAWPAAEANVAAMEAVDVAAVSVRKAFASYRTDGGHANAQQGWPAAHLLMLAVLTPLSVGAMFANGR